jgi:Fur family ferric uptake transcriptional regulator
VCGKVTEVKSDLISNAIDATHLKRFRKDGFTLYIYGICSTCQGKLTRMRNKELKKKQTLNKI